MNRKEFLKSVALIGSGLTLQGNTFLSFFKGKDFTFQELRNGIGIYVNRGGTIGWLVNKDAVIVIDAQFPDTAEIFWSEIKKLTGRKIDILFNTHHHRDHTSGNVFLSEFSKSIVAHENCVRLQKTRNTGTELDKNKVYANITFDKSWSLTIGKENMFAYHLVPAHTGGDAIFHFVNSNIVHMGDLVFNGVYPWVNKDDEASLRGWITFLEDAINHFDNDTLFIFGHSYSPEKVYGNKDDLRYMRNYIEALLKIVSKLKSDGKTNDEIMKIESVPGFENMKALWDGALKANVKAALIELNE